MVNFTNTEHSMKDLLLQVVSRRYSPREVTIQLGEVLDSQAGMINEISDSLANEQFQTIPNAPS